MGNKNLIWTITGLIVLGLLAAGYFYFLKPAKKGVVDTAKNLSKDVPKITTNPAEKIPEINPLDRANPFKYNNPLR